jgi:hypothetical protein
MNAPSAMGPRAMSGIERRIRIAGLLIAVGLVVEAASLLWHHPLSFVFFAAIAPVLILAGIASYLLALVGREGP